MSRLLAGVLAVGLVLALSLAGSGAGHASCAYPPDSPANAERADVIFTGEIIGDYSARFRPERRLVFAVKAVYKGEAYAEQVVVTSTNTSVSLDIAGPGLFLVYGTIRSARPGAPPGAGVLESDACSGTRSGDAPASLGPPRPPLPGSSGGQGISAGVIGGALAGVVALGAIGFVAVRRFGTQRDSGRPEG